MTYEFEIICSLSIKKWDSDSIANKLYEAGCDDALVGTGKRGVIGLMFDREAEDAEQAIISAINNIKAAYPEAEILEIKPDLVSMAKIAKLTGQTRQNIQKLKHFPAPVISDPSPLWHLYDVVRWYDQKGKTPAFDPATAMIAKEAWKQNLALDKQRLQQRLST